MNSCAVRQCLNAIVVVEGYHSKQEDCLPEREMEMLLYDPQAVTGQYLNSRWDVIGLYLDGSLRHKKSNEYAKPPTKVQHIIAISCYIIAGRAASPPPY